MPHARTSVITSAQQSGGLSLISLALSSSASAPVVAADRFGPIQSIGAQRLSLSQAIEAAEIAVAGCSHTAQLDIDNGTPHFAISIITPQGQQVQVHVDASTGIALRHKNQKPPRHTAASKLTLQLAIAAALQHTPGTALKAAFDQYAGRILIVVTVLTAAGQRLQIELDPENAQVLGSRVD